MCEQTLDLASQGITKQSNTLINTFIQCQYQGSLQNSTVERCLKNKKTFFMPYQKKRLKKKLHQTQVYNVSGESPAYTFTCILLLLTIELVLPVAKPIALLFLRPPSPAERTWCRVVPCPCCKRVQASVWSSREDHHLRHCK